MKYKSVQWAVMAILAASAVEATAQSVPSGGAALAKPAAISQSDLETLKSQLAALQARLVELERAQAVQQVQVAEVRATTGAVVATATEQQEAIDRTTDTLAQTRAGIGPWVSAFSWKGDLRYRNETIDQEYTLTERNRDRIRARFGFVAKVNDTVKVEIQATTAEGSDSRSSNQTLTNANARKALDLDTAYAEWAPNASWKLTFGKMKYPWARTASYFYDNDINPEGVAAAWQQGADGLFASAFYTQLGERSTQADSNMSGAQVGWRGGFGDGARYTLAAGYFNHGAAKGYNPFLDANVANAFGNSTTTSGAICRRAITACLANDYDVIDLFGEVQMNVSGKPLVLFAEYGRNTKADYAFISANPALNIPSGLDTAYSAGFTYGKASNPGTWEFGYVYQKVEKDALFGQWVDSDFAGGSTDAEGSALKFGYAFARNFRFNLTYFLNKTNNDVAAAVTVPTVRTVLDRDYKRLQLDLNMSF